MREESDTLVCRLRQRFRGRLLTDAEDAEVADSPEGRALLDKYADKDTGLLFSVARRHAKRYGTQRYGEDGCELLGPLWAALVTAVRRLASNTVKTDKAIADEFSRAIGDWHREEARAIRPPSSTLSENRKRMGAEAVPAYWHPTFVEGCLDGDTVRAGKYTDTFVCSIAKAQPTPAETVALDHTANEHEQKILFARLVSKTDKDTVDVAGVSLHTVRKTLDTIRARNPPES